jgi:hypothetical protein
VWAAEQPQEQGQKQIPFGDDNQKDNRKTKGQLQKEQKEEGQSNRFER